MEEIERGRTSWVGSDEIVGWDVEKLWVVADRTGDVEVSDSCIRGVRRL